MKYAIVNSSNVTELRNDSYSLPENSIQLTDDEYEKLCSNQYILQNGQIVVNPNPFKFPTE